MDNEFFPERDGRTFDYKSIQKILGVQPKQKNYSDQEVLLYLECFSHARTRAKSRGKEKVKQLAQCRQYD